MQQDRRNSSADNQGHQWRLVSLSTVNCNDGRVACIGVAKLSHKKNKEEVKLPRIFFTMMEPPILPSMGF